MLRWSAGLALVWSAATAVVSSYRRAIAGSAIAVADRFDLDHEQHLQRAAGDNARMLAAVRDAVPEGVLVVTELITGDPADYEPAELLRLAMRVGMIDQLRVLLFPRPILVRRVDPAAFAEARAERGEATAYLWLPGRERPAAGALWHRLHEAGDFELWLCRKD